MHACNRPLHAWFHIEERPPEDDFTNSLFDFDGDDGMFLLLSLSGTMYDAFCV